MLALSLFKGRGTKFWQFHTRGLEVAGFRVWIGGGCAHAVATPAEPFGESQEDGRRVVDLRSIR